MHLGDMVPRLESCWIRGREDSRENQEDNRIQGQLHRKDRSEDPGTI